MKWYRSENDECTIEFKNLATIMIPYTGLGTKFRLRVKCALVISILLITINAFLISCGIAQREFICILCGISLVCMWILFKTRTKAINKLIRAEIIYNTDRFSVFFKACDFGYTDGIQNGKEAAFTIKYGDIENIKFYSKNSSIEIVGTIEVEVRNQSELMEEYREVYTVEQLTLRPEQNKIKKIIDELCRRSGLSIE